MVEQDWMSYSPQEHARWRWLYARQVGLARRHGCSAFCDGLARLDCAGGIPEFSRTNALLHPATGWQLVCVPGFIPDAVFFDHLAHRRFPVTRWLRGEEELDYLVEPDVFHDFFGHVPMLFEPSVADFLQAYGEAGQRALALDALPMLARLYWYTIEFGLLDEGGALKAFGAGILSSASEIGFSVRDPHVLRLGFDPLRIMRTAYRIDAFQDTYFVLGSLPELIDRLMALDCAPIYARWRDEEPIPAGALLDTEKPYKRLGEVA